MQKVSTVQNPLENQFITVLKGISFYLCSADIVFKCQIKAVCKLSVFKNSVFNSLL